MKFTLSWLKTHLDTDASVQDIAKRLTAIGHEVESVDNPADRLLGFRIARVVTAAPHPQAGKLQVLQVDAGHGPVQVVCGAPNARAGMIGVFGQAGAVVPANAMVLRVAAIRGVESSGMMCSARELETGDDADGIIELSANATVGASFAEYAGLNDPVIDVAITPNRQDCMGVRGLARDLAAAGLGTLKPLDIPNIAALHPGPEVRTDDAEGCPAFYARSVHGVTNGASPDWMARQLRAVGQKPISALVDITNYVMIDLGRPLHVYDMATLDSGLIARKAVTGESVTALNGKNYAMTTAMTVIADASGVHDIGGIMGGMHSGASQTTTDVLIECAYFTPEHIAVTGQTLALTSDARTRFERGVDPAFLDDGLSIATDYVVQMCGGTASAATHAGLPPIAARTISYHPRQCTELAGLDVDPAEQADILAALGFGVDTGIGTSEGEPQRTTWTISVPSWRRDVSISADIVEEIARIIGLDAIPSTPLPRTDAVAKPVLTAMQLIERKTRRAAAAYGLHEAITWSFLSETAAASFGGGDWTLANPISTDMVVMRPSLIPGLLQAAARNRDMGAKSMRLFEIGRRYFRNTDGTSNERLTLGIALAGDAAPRHWQDGKPRSFDAFDVKSAVLTILDAVGAPTEKFQIFASATAQYHPGQSGAFALGPKNRMAEFGMIHPATAKLFDLDGPVAMAEIDLGAIPVRRTTSTAKPAFTPPALQTVTRDFAFLVPIDTPSADLVRAIRGADKANIVHARIFDDFRGQGVAEDLKSLAIEITLQPHDKSYDEAVLKAISDAIVAAAAKMGAVLRG